MAFVAGGIFGLLCFYAGWVYAHQTVAAECERLGGFFVGKTIYKCVPSTAPAVPETNTAPKGAVPCDLDTVQ